jgi:hypothetical protein
MLMDKFDFLESLMREEFPENQEKAIVRLLKIVSPKQTITI